MTRYGVRTVQKRRKVKRVRTVKKERTAEKYRQVEKHRTVTKHREATRTVIKTVPLWLLVEDFFQEALNQISVEIWETFRATNAIEALVGPEDSASQVSVLTSWVEVQSH